MRRQRTIGLLAVLGALLTVVVGATGAAAQAPERVVIPIDDEFADEFLTESVGFRSPPPPPAGSPSSPFPTEPSCRT